MILKILLKIKNLLDLLIYKAFLYKLPKSNPNAKPNYIEFIGVPGVGKTTLFKAVLPHLNDVIKLSDFKLVYGRKKISKKYIADETIQFLSSKILLAFTTLNFSATIKLSYLPYFLGVLKEDFLLRKVDHTYTVVEDGGVMHNFSLAITLLQQEEPTLFKDLIENRMIVYCFSSPEKVAEQILHREKATGHILPQHKDKSFEELVVTQTDDLKEKKEFIELLKAEQVEVLTINTSDSQEKNLELIKKFIENAQKTIVKC